MSVECEELADDSMVLDSQKGYWCRLMKDFLFINKKTPYLLLGLVSLMMMVFVLYADLQRNREVQSRIEFFAGEEATYLFGNLNDRLVLIINDLLHVYRDTIPSGQSDHLNRTSHLVRANPFLKTINFISSERRIRFVSPLESNKRVIGLEIGIAAPKEALEKAKTSGQPQLSAPFEIIQGQNGYSLMVPHPHGGFLELVFTATSIFGSDSTFRRHHEIDVDIIDGQQTILHASISDEYSNYMAEAEGLVMGRSLSFLPFFTLGWLYKVKG